MAHTATSQACQTSEFADVTAWSARPLASTLRSVLDALWEAFAAHREYEHLKSRGITHDTALRHAFGITRERKQPLEQVMHDQDYIENAKLNPASEFKRPMNVVAASDITSREKLTILKAWEADERALQRAEDEGMGGGEHAHLHRVQAAIIQVQAR